MTQQATPQQQQQATHLAFPLEVIEGIRKILGTLPYDTVSPLLEAMKETGVPMHIEKRPPETTKTQPAGETSGPAPATALKPPS